MSSTIKVALSGAAGNIGRILRQEIPRHGFNLRSAGGMSPLTPLHDGEDVTHGDLADPDVVDNLLRGVDVLVHMAGTSVERPLHEVVANNLVALHQVYEGARRHRVRRIVLASSNHAFGMYPVEERLKLDSPYRPDGMYGLSKVWGEAMARMYWDKHGIEGVCLRIGSAMETPPTNERQLSTWLAPDDLVQLVVKSIRAERVGWAPVWGISANARAYCDLSEGNAIGYEPLGNAEHFAAAAQGDRLEGAAQRFQGGQFVTIDFTPESDRPDRG
jgi:uronate dehydrogenase